MRNVTMAQLEPRYLKKGSPAEINMIGRLRPAFKGKNAIDELMRYSERISALETEAQAKSMFNIIGRQEALNRIAVAKKAYSNLVTAAMRLDNEIAKHNFYQKPAPTRNGLPPKAVAHEITKKTVPPKTLRITLMQAQLAPKIDTLEKTIAQAQTTKK